MRRRRLIEARRAIGLNQEQIAEVVGVDRTTLSKWERGESTPQPTQRLPYAGALRVSLAELDAMLRGTAQFSGDLPEWLSIYLGMEQSATSIQSHESRAVHGLLQTTRYVEALLSRVGIQGVSDAYAERIVDQRRYRQARIRNGDLAVDIVQPESALHLVFGGPSVMVEQLSAMAELSELPNVTLRVTINEAGQYEARRIGDFVIMEHPWGSARVHVESYGGGRFITDAEEVEYFGVAFEQACRVALSPDDSREFVRQLAGRWGGR
ncbi:helix-turn-helix domain-containing protein [Nocardia terpenica]|nr:Scr1 family TA system antitoxin-like transcriptional regulator [Nocardia terpenica]